MPATAPELAKGHLLGSYHKLSAWMAATFGHIITEKLSVNPMLTDQTKGAGLKHSVSDTVTKI